MDNGLVSRAEAANRLPIIESLEGALDALSQLFFWPVVICVLLMFGFALVSLGCVLVEAIQRVFSQVRSRSLKIEQESTLESVELEILRRLEPLRLCSRVAPMLGLVATMIPLGPALASLSTNTAATQTETLGHSFAVVIIALVSASITFSIYTVRRRWLLTELNQWLETIADVEVRDA